MQEGEGKKNSAADDIDLLLLIERTFLFFRRYKWIFLIAVILGLALGFFFYRTLPKAYKSRLVAHSFLLTNQEEIQIVANWNDLLKKKEYGLLATAFHCQEDLLHPLKSIKAEEIQKVFTATNPNGFTIEVMVTDNAILPDLQKGIVAGLENSEYVRDRIAVKRTNLQELIDKTSREIGKLDSTKQRMEQIISGHGAASSPVIIDGASINRQLIEMNEKLLSFREGLQFANAVQVLQSFSAFRQPAGPRLIVWLLAGLIFCLAIAWLYAFIHSIRMRIKNRRNNP